MSVCTLCSQIFPLLATTAASKGDVREFAGNTGRDFTEGFDLCSFMCLWREKDGCVD